MIIYVVQKGDSVYSIAQMFNVPAEKIISDNELTHPEDLVVGQTIVVLKEDNNYVVQPDDTLFSIARKFGITLLSLVQANPQIRNPMNLQAGEVLNIPLSTKKLGTIQVNGYAFPTISDEVLLKTLPYLTYLSIFSYEVLPDGSLNPAMGDDSLITMARNNNVAPMLVITNIEQGASFSSELASQVLNNPIAQLNLINNIIRTMQQKKYYGVDIDFEYLFPEDRVAYNNFLRKLAMAIKPLGYILTTAVAPKTFAEQPGILYEAHDYVAHGEIADHVIIMTYEWGYTYSPPMAVAPANQVRRVLDYAVTAIPSYKILMGMPNYGYVWNVPFIEGTAAQSISNVGAVNLARENGVFINFDETQMAPFYNYFEPTQQKEVWFDDARSVYARLKFVNEYNLGGVSYWTINQYFPQNWLVLNSMYDVEKLI